MVLEKKEKPETTSWFTQRSLSICNRVVLAHMVAVRVHPTCMDARSGFASICSVHHAEMKYTACFAHTLEY